MCIMLQDVLITAVARTRQVVPVDCTTTIASAFHTKTSLRSQHLSFPFSPFLWYLHSRTAVKVELLNIQQPFFFPEYTRNGFK